MDEYDFENEIIESIKCENAQRLYGQVTLNQFIHSLQLFSMRTFLIII